MGNHHASEGGLSITGVAYRETMTIHLNWSARPKVNIIALSAG